MAKIDSKLHFGTVNSFCLSDFDKFGMDILLDPKNNKKTLAKSHFGTANEPCSFDLDKNWHGHTT